ncbi:hypothetical protein GOODEAATRI_004050, partial [Goodea atripinnis]
FGGEDFQPPRFPAGPHDPHDAQLGRSISDVRPETPHPISFELLLGAVPWTDWQWISQFPAVFEKDPLLEQTMGDLWELVRLDGEKTHSQPIDTSCL